MEILWNFLRSVRNPNHQSPERKERLLTGGVVMKIEIGKEFPQYFKPLYPEEFELFSHFEVTAGIPTVLFAVTTWKENGKPNVCFHSWSCFHGDRTAFFAVLGNLYQHTHTYANDIVNIS